MGFGFTDLVRRPTGRVTELLVQEIRSGAVDLARRQQVMGDRPAIVFMFSAAWQAASPLLHDLGFKTSKFPGPYAANKDVEDEMWSLCASLGNPY